MIRAIVSGVVLSIATAAFAQSTQSSAPKANLAIVATPSASYVSGDQSVLNLNNGFNPRRSNDSTHGAYGNWPHVGTEWIEYDWSKPINTNHVDVYWFADGQGIKLPKASRLLYWNNGKFESVPDAKGLGVDGNVYNPTDFPGITTTKLRLEMDSAATGVNFSTGVLQWKVLDAGGSPEFPPIVHAGESRIAVSGGKTYLTPQIRQITGRTSDISWSKTSGPGNVTFADAHAAITTAYFSAPGDYVITLSAGDGKENSTDSLKVQVVDPAPKTHMEPVYTTSWQLHSKFWNDRIKNTIINWIPHCYTELSDPTLKEGGIENFILAGKKLAGVPLPPGSYHVGYPFANAYVYNTIEAMSVALMVDPQGDPDIIKAQNNMRYKLDEWIPLILAAQEPDGYLQTRFTLGVRGERAAAQHWNPRTRGEHEGYVAGYFIEAAIANYIATGGKDLRLYNAAKKLANCWYDNIGPAPKQAWYDGHEEIEQALMRFGRFVDDVEGDGQGDKYMELAKFLLDCRGQDGGSNYDQTSTHVYEQYEAVGHAVRAVYLYSAMADVVMETGDIDYQSSVSSIWDDLVNRKYYITGGVGSGETSEGFGPDYSLRNNAYCESCSGCGELFFQWKMNMEYQDAKYADLYERTLYNAILGDLDLDGKNFTYTNALDTGPRGAGRYLWHTCPCCVGNIPRVLLALPTWTYTRNDDSLNVNLFVGSTATVPKVAGTDVQIVQNTDYPWSNKASIIVNPSESKQFTVRVRMPQYEVSGLYTPDKPTGATEVSLNGEKITPKIVSGYAVINRTWKMGDTIDLVLPMQVQKVTPNSHITADKNKVALLYGPLVYNLENVDQDGKLNTAISPDAPLTTEWKPDLLGGVITINGKFSDGSPLVAIPNYARDNRGGRSMVWINDSSANAPQASAGN